LIRVYKGEAKLLRTEEDARQGEVEWNIVMQGKRRRRERRREGESERRFGG
jgi:hypothetical protein